MPTESTARQWTFDPEHPERINPVRTPTSKKSNLSQPKKQKPHTREPEERYPWLANILDADRNPPGHPDYDPRTIYIPPQAWNNFSPFEKQYWEIKRKFWDTIVFFKKGKFYELYENDATVGHQLFDLKLTDRVNMRMVGVPESSLDYWANQFVAKGFKIARVDQMESALAKEMRERDEDVGKKKGPPKKEERVIRRELASVLTAGTLVEPGMLQDDMSTFCAAIKEIDRDNHPAFGIAFVDTATAQFFLTEFDDDVDMTKFETFVAQTRPGELLLEKSCISAKALRILKNNTTPTTIWNYLKPPKEFWPADVTCREIDASGYFVSSDHDNIEAWPTVLLEAREKELVMSALGALVQYLRTLKIERDLVTLGNFSWYDPIKKASTLVLDGQTLINLEIFANTFDGGSEGTLFAMLNRCITPFGKRMLRQWVCHPLADARKINARLDAVDTLMADRTLSDNFSVSLSRIPDLERLISRVHAGRCKAQDFVRVLEGFEQIEYTISLLGDFAGQEGLIGQLIFSMPDLNSRLKQWKDAFDRKLAKQDGILVPEAGVEEDYDDSQENIDQCLRDLDDHLKWARRELGSNLISYKDNGKEIYQLEVPAKVESKRIPKGWNQMSATKSVKRYYNPELRKLVRALQEAQETHSQIVKEVAGRFYTRFDQDYNVWLAAVKIIAQLDCLISLAKSSQSLGQPSCRPTFVNDERTVIEFEELRHPCMLTSVDNFIPNDIKLGGSTPNIDLLTGANAAGKSTVLRMTCIAVILAQIGCHIPCISARLTPIDRIMSRLGAHDNIFAAQSTFFVELSETKKILAEATPRSLVILDELGRGTSSYDGVAVAQAVLHEVATRIGCVGFFATHYRSLAEEFASHPEIRCARMAIEVDDAERRVTFLYKLEPGVAEGSFGMHCAAMCGIPGKVVENAEVAAKEWEHTSRLKESLEKAREGCYVPLGVQSDVAWIVKEGLEEEVEERALEVLRKAIAKL
jgi:DNA mismatch repair protein MSH6